MGIEAMLVSMGVKSRPWCYTPPPDGEKPDTKRVEKWNENVETCSDCGIHWKKIGKCCPVCYAPAEEHDEQDFNTTK